jgi:streptomycin 6-kinase
MMIRMAGIAIPPNLATSPGIPASWLAQLPDTVADLAQRWSLSLGNPYQPGGMTSWVAPVTTADGRPLVLKVMWPHTESMHEADALERWGGDGAIHLDATHITDEFHALLIERCAPGTTLASAVAEEDQDVVLTGLLRRLWAHHADGSPFRPLQEMCDYWADEFGAKLAANPSRIDAGLAREGVTLLRELPASASQRTLLCTDLHADNVLAAQREPWLVIDPKPYVGDPTYDLVQHMLNCPSRLDTDPHAFVDRLASLTDLDADRLRLWLFARCVQASWNTSGVPWAGVDIVDVATRLRP